MRSGTVRVRCLLGERTSGRESGSRRPAAGPTEGGYRAMPNHTQPDISRGALAGASHGPASVVGDRLSGCSRLSPVTVGFAGTDDVPHAVARPRLPGTGRPDTTGPTARGIPFRLEGSERPDRPGLLSRAHRRSGPNDAIPPNGWRGVGPGGRFGIGDSSRRSRPARRLGAHLLGPRGMRSSGRDTPDRASGAAARAVGPGAADVRPAA